MPDNVEHHVNSELRVNGKRVRVSAHPGRSLLSVLRDDLDLTGAKYGCGEGQCGACTVLLDGAPVRSCLTPIGSVGERAIATVEGLEQGGKLHPVQEAFVEADAFQCGYCTPGMVMAGVALLQDHPAPTRTEIARRMEGHLCRCGMYSRILAALEQAAKAARRAGE